MTSSVETPYATFLARAQAALGSVGARPLLGAEEPDNQLPWAADWDLILAADTPGSSTVYAFTEAPSYPGALGGRVEALSSGLSKAGVLSHGPINLVTITAVHAGRDPSRMKEALRAAPRTYYANLRPSAWAIDLDTGRVASSRGLGQPEGKEQLRWAADLLHSPLDVASMSAAQEEHRVQLRAFRDLIQGRQPVVTYALIAINVAMYLLVYLAGGNYDQNLPRFGALIPQDVMHGDWWRLIAAMFLHAGPTHILFNMISLFVVGSLAERLYGSLKFLAIYLGSGLVGSLAGLLYSLAIGDLYTPHVGASGAIFGIAGALMTMRFQRSDVIPSNVRQRISTSMITLVAINLVVLSFTPNIDNSAHIGGLLGGVALSFVFPLARRIPETVH